MSRNMGLAWEQEGGRCRHLLLPAQLAHELAGGRGQRGGQRASLLLVQVRVHAARRRQWGLRGACMPSHLTACRASPIQAPDTRTTETALQHTAPSCRCLACSA